MLVLVLEAVLLRLQYKAPSCPALFQLPPTIAEWPATTHCRSMYPFKRGEDSPLLLTMFAIHPTHATLQVVCKTGPRRCRGRYWKPRCRDGSTRHHHAPQSSKRRRQARSSSLPANIHQCSMLSRFRIRSSVLSPSRQYPLR